MDNERDDTAEPKEVGLGWPVAYAAQQGVKIGLAATLAKYGHLLAPSEPRRAETATSSPPVGSGMTVAAVTQAAEEYVRANGWPGRNELARVVGCAGGTITKAAEQSHYLRARRAEHDAAKPGTVRTVALTDRHLETLGDDSAHAGLERLTAQEKDAELVKEIARQAKEIRQEDQQWAKAAKGRR